MSSLDGSLNDSLGDVGVAFLGGKDTGSMAVGTAVAGILGGIAGGIGLALGINGAMQAFGPPQG